MPLNEKGMELPDSRSLVAVCDLKPVTMGERIRRYTRTPQLRDDLVFHDENFDLDIDDEDDRPMSPHEERYGAFMARRKARQLELDKKREEEAAERKRADDAEFAARVAAVKASIEKENPK